MPDPKSSEPKVVTEQELDEAARDMFAASPDELPETPEMPKGVEDPVV